MRETTTTLICDCCGKKMFDDYKHGGYLLKVNISFIFDKDYRSYDLCQDCYDALKQTIEKFMEERK